MSVRIVCVKFEPNLVGVAPRVELTTHGPHWFVLVFPLNPPILKNSKRGLNPLV